MGNKDIIYRQDAIDAIMSEPPDAHYPSWYASILKGLPSAEPKIIYCKDCKHYRSYAGIIDGYCDMAEWYGRFQNPNDFCSRAKRRTDE